MPDTVHREIKLHYEVRGSGTPVLFLAGTMSSHLVWAPLFERLSGIQAVLPDNRDSGLSDLASQPYSIRNLAEDALAVLDHTAIDRVHVVGHSMGAAIAIELALLAPSRVRSLGIINGWARTDTYTESLLRLWIRLREALVSESDFLEALFSTTMGAPMLRAMPLRQLAQLTLAMAPLQSPVAFRRNVEADIAFDAADRLTDIACPVLVIHGTEDRVLPAWHVDQLMAVLTSANLVKLPGVGHNAIIEAPDEVAAALARAFSGGEQ